VSEPPADEALPGGPRAFDILAAQALPDLLRHDGPQLPVRVWAPACSTGEEAYFLAIWLFEHFRAAGREPHLRIFASDADEGALRATRLGLYDARIEGLVSAEQLQRYFERTAPQRYRVRDQVRATVTVATHNLLSDPPAFSNLDLISYRNIPADLTADIRRRLMSRFHFALRRGGWLLLDVAPAVAPPAALFASVSGKRLLYQQVGREGPSAGTQPTRELWLRKSELEDELLTANRTIASMTEELEIANEELTASNVELRSLNQELRVLNGELQQKVAQLNAANDDLATLITAMDVAVVFLDEALRLRRFTPPAAHLLPLTPHDLGRSLSEMTSAFVDRGLLDEARLVIETDAASEREMPSGPHRWYLRRVLPYPAGEPPAGVVISWVDITQTKSLQLEVSQIATLEQQRIGQELHDGTQQELTGLGLLAQSLSDSLARGDRQAEHALAHRLALGLASANQHVRTLARGLVPVPIDAESLAPALADLARSTEESFEVSCDFELAGPVTIGDASSATHLYRIAQEAIRNATRHSKADRISIRLASAEGDLLLEVRDNGIGIPPRTRKHRGVGLRLMEHRCSLLGGRFSAEQHPAGGTVVACLLPAAGTRANA
jgi:signal transduction histidine kinase